MIVAEPGAFVKYHFHKPGRGAGYWKIPLHSMLSGKINTSAGIRSIKPTDLILAILSPAANVRIPPLSLIHI